MVDLSLDPALQTSRIILFLQENLKKTPFRKVIIGLSGGIDSATAATLIVKALGAKNILVALLPYEQLGNEGLSSSTKIVNMLTIPQENIFQVDIKPPVDSLVSSDKNIDNIRRGNIMARVRMIILYDLAKKHQALVCGTENKTEYLLGYFTRFGDEASDIEPIRHLYKTQVKQLAKYLNLPPEVVSAIPTAGLWPGQTDEDEFGFSYEVADQILYLYYEKKLTREEIIQSGFKKEIVEKVLKRVGENEFKHKLPFILPRHLP